MKTYSSLLQSGIAWLQEIPAHWELKTIKSILIDRKEKNSPILTDFILSLTARHGVIPQTEKTGGGNKPKDDISRYYLAYPNDLLINCMNVVSGSSGVSRYFGAISPVYYALMTRDENTHIRFIGYLFRMKPFYQSLVGLGNGIMMKKSSTGNLNTVRKRIPMRKLNAVLIPHPPREEQDIIVKFLDWKVAEVNNFIQQKRREILLLDELKQAIIYKAVTFGIDPKVNMKPSELSIYVEQLPTTWEEVKLKRILTKLDRPYTTDEEVLICSNKGTVFPRGDKRIGLVSIKDDIYQGVAEGDLLIHGMDTWHGAIAISGFSGKCTTVVHVCESIQDKRFIAYYLRMLAFRKLYKAISNGVRQNTSDFRSWSKAGDIIIALPPLSEQNIIADYIDARCQEIESMIAALRSEISLITEYRTRMISDVVTGKVDIRDIEVSSIAVKEINVESFEVEESDEITDVEVEEDADD